MEDSGPETGCCLEEVLATDKLERRVPRASDFALESQALTDLAEELANCPENLLSTLANSVLSCCRAESAGVCILDQAEGADDAQVLRWHAVAGHLAEHAGASVPQDHAPCAVVIERDETLLFERPARRYPALAVEPPVTEALLVPFHVDGQPIGTIWALSHSERPAFDAEDVRLLDRLSRFAAYGYQIHSEMRERERAHGMLQQAYREQKLLSSRLRHFATEMTAAEHRSRKRFASEMQENLQQLLIAARLQLASGAYDRGPAEHIREAIDEAVEVSRRLLGQLRPPGLYEIGLLPALQRLAEDMRDQQGLAVEVEYDEDGDEPPVLSDDLRVLLFEAVRELLQNVSKHAGTDQAVVRLHSADSSATITVEDRGHGFAVDEATSNRSQGVGLFGIRERLAAFGAAVAIHSTAGQGTRVVLNVPTATPSAGNGGGIGLQANGRRS